MKKLLDFFYGEGAMSGAVGRVVRWKRYEGARIHSFCVTLQ